MSASFQPIKAEEADVRNQQHDGTIITLSRTGPGQLELCGGGTHHGLGHSAERGCPLTVATGLFGFIFVWFCCVFSLSLSCEAPHVNTHL